MGGYILVEPEALKAKGISFFETIPDGRAIADMSTLKMLGNVKVEIISTTEELKSLIAEQKADLAKKESAEHNKKGGKK